MSRRRRRQRADKEHDLGLVDFVSEAEESTPTVPSRPWPAAGAEIVGQSWGGDAPALLPVANPDFPSEGPLPLGSAVTADAVPVRVAAARPAPPPNARPRVVTFSVYAMVVIGGAAVGWVTGSFTRTPAPEANNDALVPSESLEWVPFAALRQPVRGGSIQLANAAPEERAEARAPATPPPNAANVPSVNQAARPAAPRQVTPPAAPPPSGGGAVTRGAASPGLVVPSAHIVVPTGSAQGSIAETPPTVPPTASPAVPRSGAGVAAAASTPEVPKPEPPRAEPSRPASAVTEPPRAEAPRAEVPRADASRPELPRAEMVRRRETGLIETVLDRYVGAFNTLDAEATRAVWPSVDARALDRVFTQLEEQELTFEECRVELDEVRATAVCRGTARYVPRVGNRSSRITPRQWTFRLQKVDDRWTIDGVNIR